MKTNKFFFSVAVVVIVVFFALFVFFGGFKSFRAQFGLVRSAMVSDVSVLAQNSRPVVTDRVVVGQVLVSSLQSVEVEVRDVPSLNSVTVDRVVNGVCEVIS